MNVGSLSTTASMLGRGTVHRPHVGDFAIEQHARAARCSGRESMVAVLVGFGPVQLEDHRAVATQHLEVGPAVHALRAEQCLVPAGRRFDVVDEEGRHQGHRDLPGR